MNSFNLDSLVRKNVLGLKPYSSARDEFKDFNTDMIFLDANENPFENGVNRYPDPQQRSLKSLLSTQKGIPQEQLLLGNGSDEVLDLIYRVFCEPNRDNIITLPPTYGMYNVLAETNAITNKEVLLTTDFEIDTKSIFEAIDKNTKLIFICSPNNPTGNSFASKNIVLLLQNFNGIVVIDEAYIDFSEEESWLKRLNQFPNLIVTQTLSKAYGLAGIRLGICYASQAIIHFLNKIKAPYNVNELTQNRASQRLASYQRVQQEVVKIVEERNDLIASFKNIPFIKKIYPTDANFILVKVDNADKRYSELIQKGIVIRNRSTQPLCENTLRFTVGTVDENKQLLKVLNEIS